MKDVLKQTYELYETKLLGLLNEVADTKIMLNKLAKDLGQEQPFADVSVEAINTKKIRPDQFYNKALATAVREFLEMGGSAKEWGEIVRALREGGYDLPKASEDDARLTVLRNTSNFVLIGNSYFGLRVWYGEKKDRAEKISLKGEVIILSRNGNAEKEYLDRM